MTTPRERWTLGAKLAAAGIPFLLLGLLITALTLWASWQLDGGAAAVNGVGRLRMQAWRLAWKNTLDPARHEQTALIERFDATLALLEKGDPERPLVMPWDSTVQQRFDLVTSSWRTLRASHLAGRTEAADIDRATTELVDRIDSLVSAVEVHLSRFTSLVHLLQVALLVLGTLASSVLVVTGYHFVLEPVAGLKRAVSALQSGDLSARVEPHSSDEMGTLAAGFNDMAERLQASYTDLEGKVREKTAELQEKRERLQALYDVSLLVAHAGSLQELAEGFTRRVRAVARADAAALRWANVGADQFVMLASDGIPESMARDEHCIRSGECFCGRATAQGQPQVIPIRALGATQRRHCEHAGWATVVAVPIRTHERLIGEFDLFYFAEASLGDADRALLDTLCSHLASGMETLRLAALEREAAVAEERAFLARELHDSIAQSLAFLNIQAQLMRKAMAEGNRERMAQVMSEIELGLHESHGDVRELLVHFRTRTNAEDIEHALAATLRKFEHQAGVPSTLSVHDAGLPLAADVQVQALHIVQEALSNVRKHARAAHVWVDVWKRPRWRISVRDDGIGFAQAASLARDDTHVGLRIMRERAQRLGAELAVASTPGAGTTITLTLPAATGEAPAAAPNAITA